MCWTCFKKYATEPVMTIGVVRAAQMILAAPGEPEFGFLHIIVGDWNVDDRFFDPEGNDGESDAWPTTEDVLAAEPWEREIWSALEPLSEAERATVLAIVDGYVDAFGITRGDLS